MLPSNKEVDAMPPSRLILHPKVPKWQRRRLLSLENWQTGAYLIGALVLLTVGALVGAVVAQPEHALAWLGLGGIALAIHALMGYRYIVAPLRLRTRLLRQGEAFWLPQKLDKVYRALEQRIQVLKLSDEPNKAARTMLFEQFMAIIPTWAAAQQAVAKADWEAYLRADDQYHLALKNLQNAINGYRELPEEDV